MRLLLDECVPARLRHDLTGCEVQIVPQAGWAGIKNGRLLKLIADADKFDVFLTVDKNLPHEQKISGLPFAVVVLRTRSNSITDVRPFVPEILRRLSGFQPGKVFILNPPH
jgi:predicted nuclease of predicted toxin-antitoxin system